MSKEFSQPRGLPQSQILLLMLIVAFFVMVGIKYYPALVGKDLGPLTTVPKEFQVNYLPADFSFAINEQDALGILTNPRRYRREFNQLVYDLNLGILRHVANRMGLDAATRAKLPEVYERHHRYLRNLYYEDFLSIQDTTSTIYQTWYDNKFKGATDVLYEVAAKYTCYLVNNVIGTLIPLRDGAFFAKGRKVETPCGIAMSEALAPLMKRLEDRAAVEDFGSARGLLQEKVGKVVSELATYELRDKKGLSKELKTKIWGLNVSTTNLEISAISIMKIGFRLQDHFQIQLNNSSRLVVVTLPQPTILSHEVYPRMDRLSIGWLREVREDDLNRAFNLLREEFRRDALGSDAFEKAQTHAKAVMNTMLGPMIQNFDRRYKLKIQFQSPTQQPEFEPRDPLQDLDVPQNIGS